MKECVTNHKPIRIAVTGASGRMACQLVKVIAKSKKVILGAALSRNSSSLYGVDIGTLSGIDPLGVKINYNFSEIKDDFDVLIDFTRPCTSLNYLDLCQQHHKNIVIGTTGFSEEQKKKINLASKEVAIVFSSNFSIFMNLILKLLEKTARVIGNETDIEIIEAHHRYKIDSPSGTALAMGKSITDALGFDLNQCAVYSRHGSFIERKKTHIGFSTIRAGDIVGEHTAMFVGFGERLEITHKASKRIAYARGAVRAAIWLHEKKTGLYDMIEVLHLEEI